MQVVCEAGVTVEVDATALAAATKSDAFREIIEKAEQEKSGGSDSQLPAHQDDANAWRLVWGLVMRATPEQLDWGKLPSVLRLADKYQLKDVTSDCEKLVVHNLVDADDGTKNLHTPKPHNLGAPPRISNQNTNMLGADLLSLFLQLQMWGAYKLFYTAYRGALISEMETATYPS